MFLKVKGVDYSVKHKAKDYLYINPEKVDVFSVREVENGLVKLFYSKFSSEDVFCMVGIVLRESQLESFLSGDNTQDYFIPSQQQGKIQP